MTKLSVNINKLATLRNARGHNNPNIFEWAKKIESWGAQGITVHPRPDERHIRKTDVHELADNLNVEFNIEGYPNKAFCQLVLAVRPDQVTLVPDSPTQLTSDHGWDTQKYQTFLKDIIAPFKSAGIRTSLFLDPNPGLVESAAETGAERIELYTEAYARSFDNGTHENVVMGFTTTAKKAQELGMGVNAGHDLDLNNLAYFLDHVPQVLEVSIGHALVCDALELGMKETINRYLSITQ